jgi:tetratricopeptide (TPR) repeat protein
MEKSKFSPRLLLVALAAASTSLAQVPDNGPAAPAPAPAPAQQQAPAPSSSGGGGEEGGDSAGGSKQQGSILGGDVPVFDPGSEIFTWDGKSWHATDNRLFQARFEKYLNAPEETGPQATGYQQIINTILDDLAPGNASVAHVDDAFRLLSRASLYDIDARLCDSIADAVYSAWRAADNQDRLANADEALEQERKQTEWNAKIAAQGLQLDQAPGGSGKDKTASQAWVADENTKRDMEMTQYTTRLAEIQALIKTNQAKKELSELDAKIEFQALLVQLFLQRRFQHVLIGTRFYRAIFTDGDTTLQVGKDSHDMFANTTGMPPTVGTMDSMANEIIRDVREGVQAFQFLLSQNELESASKRLAESFVTGEYLPEIRTLPRSQKRQALAFVQQSDQLLSALEVKDYTLAEKLVTELSKTATDFDTSKATAAIETAKQISALHLAKARNAAVSGDKVTLEEELKEATEIWPRNPALTEISGLIFSQSDVQQKALVDLDELLSQHNYREIYNDKMRFIAAAAMYPDRQKQLADVLGQMETIETSMIQAREMAKQGDYAGAWEAVEKTFEKFPDDSKLNEMRADLTTQAADFVRTIRTAQDLEQKDEVGSSLAWYLKAQKIYPSSEFAQEGIQRLTKLVFPESS